ncbi:RING finger protein 215-like [Hoplias malabaricus]|uniref:RING finger protein 215-like n=1 Tax=Hoplias malabaricus TaxID=27720 RepID=UPI0034627260
MCVSMSGGCVLLCVCLCVYGVAVCVDVDQEQVCVSVEVCIDQDSDRVLQGQILQDDLNTNPALNPHKTEPIHTALHGDLRLIRDEDEDVIRSDESVDEDEDEDDDEDDAEEKRKNPWIGVVPVDMEENSSVSSGNQESFASSVVNKMKKALVLGASALILLVLNQNTLREMDLSQVLSKPVIVIQTSENVTKLFGALLRGLHATAKITYKTFLQNNLGATLTLWSSCGRSRGGVYGEWQGVVCTGETNSPVQKYLQQLWNTVVLVALILSTGVIVHARWHHQDDQHNDELQLHHKQELISRLSSLKTRTFRTPRPHSGQSPGQTETDNCAVCLEQYNNKQCLRVLPCLHEFHKDCVDPWLLLQQTCPLCKRSVFGNVC